MTRWPRGTLYPLKLALTSPTRGRSRTQAREFSFFLEVVLKYLNVLTRRNKNVLKFAGKHSTAQSLRRKYVPNACRKTSRLQYIEGWTSVAGCITLQGVCCSCGVPDTANRATRMNVPGVKKLILLPGPLLVLHAVFLYPRGSQHNGTLKGKCITRSIPHNITS
jgi:hypothetical protein